jgi:hypothetical protein
MREARSESEKEGLDEVGIAKKSKGGGVAGEVGEGGGRSGY